MIEVEGPDGTVAEFPDGTPQTIIKSAMQKRFAPKEPPPGYGGASVDRSDPKPLWDVPGDIWRSFKGSVDAMKADAARAFPSAAALVTGEDPPMPKREGFAAALKRTPGQLIEDLGRMGSALKVPLDAIGAAVSPVTGTVKATAGSAMSYLPAMNKTKADEAVDLAMSAIPARGNVKPPKVSAPTVAELKQAGDAGYKAARSMGVEIKPDSTSALADSILSDLTQNGHRDYLSPKTFRALEELKSPPGGSSTISDIEGVRRILGEAGKDMAERAAARTARSRLDDYVQNIDPADVIAGDPALAAKTLREARGNVAAQKRAERVQKAMDDADVQAASTYSGGNLDNATRQKLRSILTDDRKTRGWSDEELAQLDQAVRGTTVGNALRATGKILGGGGGIGAYGVGAGTAMATGNPLGLMLPMVGKAAARGGAASTARQAEKLDEMLRMNSPLGRSRQTQGLMSTSAPDSVGAIGLMNFADQVSRNPRLNALLDWLARQDSAP